MLRCDNQPMEHRAQTLGEEIANSVSHGVALLAALAAVPFLFVVAMGRNLGATQIVALAVFGATLLMLYLASTLYHALPKGRAKRVFMKLDHGAIYLFIAGSYTPFALGALSGAWGWTLFAAVWSLAVIGVTLKATNRLSHPWVSTGLYLVMGWMVLAAVVPLVERVPAAGVAWLLAGGLAYSAGEVFYMLDSRVRYAHAVWHGFVIAGTSCHYVAVLGYAA